MVATASLFLFCYVDLEDKRCVMIRHRPKSEERLSTALHMHDEAVRVAFHNTLLCFAPPCALILQRRRQVGLCWCQQAVKSKQLVPAIHHACNNATFSTLLVPGAYGSGSCRLSQNRFRTGGLATELFCACVVF